MNNEHRDRLRKNFVQISQQINIDEEFLSYLQQYDCLSDNTVEEILIQTTMSKKFHSFHKKILRTNPEAYTILVYTLLKTNQRHLAVLLHDDVDSVWNSYESDSKLKHNGGGDTFINDPLLQLVPEEEFKVIREMGKDRVAVKRLTQESSKNFIKSKSPNMYKVGQETRGEMLLISNEFFTVDDLPKRVGTLYDEMDITDLFQALNFNVKRYKDLTGEMILKRIKEFAAKIVKGSCEMFIFCILSHGDKGIVYGVDGVKVPIETITTTFDGINCAALRGCPRLFIIQACQGDNKSSGTTVADSKKSITIGPDEKPNVKSSVDSTDSNYGDQLTVDPARSRTQSDAKKSSVLIPIHEKCDEIVAYSTVKDYLCWRHETEGSWFIQDLITVFAENAYKEHLADLLQMVTDKIINRITDDLFIQVPVFNSSLSKKFYFMPGYKNV